MVDTRTLDELAGPAGAGGLRHWPVPRELVESPEVAYRNRYAELLGQRDYREIAAQYVYLSPEQMADLLDVAAQCVGAAPFSGIGLELGAGCGLLSATVARAPDVRAVLAVEVCEGPAGLIAKMSRGVLGEAQADRVIPVVGSFNDLRVPDGSIDFMVEIDSLHHSGDLVVTLRECWRALRPGGQILMIDRCHPNTFTDADVERSLNIVYKREFLIANGYPPDIRLTRRENGEHEYRVFEWFGAFEKAGFRLVSARRLLKTTAFRKAVKGLFRPVPPLYKRVLRGTGGSLGDTWRWATQHARPLLTSTDLGRPVLAPVGKTVMLIEKPR